MKDLSFAVLLLGMLLPSTVPRRIQFYRKDYKYIEEFDAFYKVHWDVSGSAWSTAFFTCDDEGSSLFYPKAQGEWTLAKKLTNTATYGPNVTDIFVGLHDEVKFTNFRRTNEYSSSDFVPSDSNVEPQPYDRKCMTMNIDTGLFKVSSCLRTPDTALPFLCKRVDDESCPTIDRGYKYVKSSKKCYKVHKKPAMWQEAMKTCFLEGGILAVIEDPAQEEDISAMLSFGTYYFIGVRQLNSRDDFYTVKGQKLSNLYLNQKIHRSNIYTSFGCEAVYNGNYGFDTKALNCTDMAPFICEM